MEEPDTSIGPASVTISSIESPKYVSKLTMLGDCDKKDRANCSPVPSPTQDGSMTHDTNIENNVERNRGSGSIQQNSCSLNLIDSPSVEDLDMGKYVRNQEEFCENPQPISFLPPSINPPTVVTSSNEVSSERNAKMIIPVVPSPATLIADIQDLNKEVGIRDDNQLSNEMMAPHLDSTALPDSDMADSSRKDGSSGDNNDITSDLPMHCGDNPNPHSGSGEGSLDASRVICATSHVPENGSGKQLMLIDSKPDGQCNTTTKHLVRLRSSCYHGVSRNRWTGKFEAHLWDGTFQIVGRKRKGKLVYLGGYESEEKAGRAHDLAAIKYWGTNSKTKLNFNISEYQSEIEEMKGMTREEYVASLIRKSSCFSRGASMFRGVTRKKDGRWQARIGRVADSKDIYLGTFGTEEEAAEAYDIAAIELRGLNAVTNFDISNYSDDIKRWLDRQQSGLQVLK